ncbi:hypothetical protein JL108_14075 [Aeromicrobium sp. YIM 150415]|uniref:AAA family ATPase n=1 Tax=Aeromicrobium sp. YIM 150415 TaxID=2803912 RepID=UPI0019627238|nr:hypothetical protein [Aeromicrobium sp. YIM 150415]MBM9464582.1 hypothetical protein [Aeromicrobium sp. YIM 150415]
MIATAVAAGGASWEGEVLDEVERSSALTLVRRCVDAADLLAIASTGRVQVALVDPALGGLDLDVVSRVRSGGVRIVAVGTPAPELGLVGAVQVGDVEAAAQEDDLPRPEAPRSGRIIAVWGPTGAPGRTSVALAMAASLAREAPTVLVDADTHGGAVGQALGLLDDVSGIVAACRAANGGKEMPGSAILRVGDGLDVMTGVPRPEDMWHLVRPAALTAVLDSLAAAHRWVVVDAGFGHEPPLGTGPARDQAAMTVLEAADEVVVVGRPEPLGLARLVRILGAGAPWRVEPHVVVNLCRTSLGWSETEIAATVQEISGHQVEAFLPHDASAHDLAAISGRLTREVAPTSSWVSRLDHFTGRFLREPAATLRS